MSGFSAVTYALAKKAAKAYTDKIFSQVEGLNIVFADALPTQDISIKTIYFVPHSSNPDDYSYDEYMYVDDNWKLIGSTELRLEDYYTKNELKTELVNILPIATNTSLGAIKIDDKTLVINENGVASVNFSSEESGSVQDLVQNQIDDNFTNISDSDIDSLF